MGPAGFYHHRQHAGEVLAELLLPYRGNNAIVLAVPRGGVAVAMPIVTALNCTLDLVITRKIGAPGQPELAIGAVCADGRVHLDRHAVRALGVSQDYIHRAAAAETAEIGRRLALYRGPRPLPVLNSRTVIVVDDGVATGFTLRAALQSIRQQKPSQLVLAVPVGPPDTLSELAQLVDNLVCPLRPLGFMAVGQFYQRFEQLSDAEVEDLLRQARRFSLA